MIDGERTVKAQLKHIEKLIGDVHEAMEEVDMACDDLCNAWLEHQVRTPPQDFGWHPRTEQPPAGKVWASDGLRVWMINSDGVTPIQPAATKVKYWCVAFLPRPPYFDKGET
jgi:hypothetical protein